MERLSAGLAQIVVHDLAEPERKVRNYVDCGYDFYNRQLSDRCQSVRRQRQRSGAGPRALYENVIEMILDQFTDARAAVNVRNDFEQKIGRFE